MIRGVFYVAYYEPQNSDLGDRDRVTRARREATASCVIVIAPMPFLSDWMGGAAPFESAVDNLNHERQGKDRESCGHRSNVNVYTAIFSTQKEVK